MLTVRNQRIFYVSRLVPPIRGSTPTRAGPLPSFRLRLVSHYNIGSRKANGCRAVLRQHNVAASKQILAPESASGFRNPRCLAEQILSGSNRQNLMNMAI